MEPPSPAVRFDEKGLVPCVIQDWRSGEVLTLAYMNAEALQLSQETGELHLFSRSRQELWHKGATSGNTQQVRALRYDCDADAVLALVEPSGPACPTGERTCFFTGDRQAAPHATPRAAHAFPPAPTRPPRRRRCRVSKKPSTSGSRSRPATPESSSAIRRSS